MDVCELTRQLILWYNSGKAEDFQRMLAMMDPQCAIFGPGGKNQYPEIGDFLQDLVGIRANNQSRGITFRFTDVWCREMPFGEASRITYGGMAVFCDRADGQPPQKLRGRFTVGFRPSEDGWRVMHIHFSVANQELQSGEHFPNALWEEITASQEEAKQLRELANHDSLTGMLNLRALQRCYQKNSHQGLWLIEADLDNFKGINDTYGHVAGNRVLTLASRILKESVRSHDIVARTGGDEFILLLSAHRREAATAVLERILHRVEEVAQLEDCWTHLSMGAVRVRPGESLQNALNRADKALYQVKNQGKCSYKIADEPSDSSPIRK